MKASKELGNLAGKNISNSLLQPTEKLFSIKTNAAGLIGGHKQSIDHMGPLCALLDIPLLTNDPFTQLTYEKFYPGLRVELATMDLPHLVERFDTFFYAFEPTPLFRDVIKKSQDLNPNNLFLKKKSALFSTYMAALIKDISALSGLEDQKDT